MKCLDYTSLIKVNCVIELLNKNLKHRGEKNVYLQKPVCYLSISFNIMLKKEKRKRKRKMAAKPPHPTFPVAMAVHCAGVHLGDFA